MKTKGLLGVLLCAVLILALLPVTALAEDAAPADGYNDHDYNALQAFFETENGGVKNGTWINSAYDKDNPATWSGVTWSTDTEKRLVSVSWSNEPIGGALDLSGCTSLEGVYCVANNLTSVNVSGCSSLAGLRCDSNYISSVDITGCSALTTFTFNDNKLASLDLKSFSQLEFVQCENNAQLTTLDISGLAHLQEVLCDGSALTALNVSGSSIETIDCSNNSLTALDLTGCSIEELDCSGNQLGSLNADGITALTDLDCSSNSLTGLSLAGCSSLQRLICSGNALSSLTLTDCSGSLVSLDCGGNALTALDLSGYTALKGVVCSDNSISSLSLGPNTMALLCGNNMLTSLDVSAYALLAFDCTGNPLRSVDAVYNGDDISLRANGSGYVTLYFYPSLGYYALAAPETGVPFVNWTNASDGSEASADAQYDLKTGTDYSLNANFLTLSSSVPGGAIYTGGNITLTPNIAGGTWSFDKEGYLSGNGNVFTGLKEGVVRVTYTLGQHSTYYDVTVSTVLALTLSPEDGNIYTDGRIIITPNIEGGTWSFDGDYLSRDGYKFTGLKAGTVRVTYTAGTQSAYADVIISASTLPSTGQDYTGVWALCGLAGLIMLGTSFARKKLLG